MNQLESQQNYNNGLWDSKQMLQKMPFAFDLEDMNELTRSSWILLSEGYSIEDISIRLSYGKDSIYRALNSAFDQSIGPSRTIQIHEFIKLHYPNYLRPSELKMFNTIRSHVPSIFSLINEQLENSRYSDLLVDLDILDQALYTLLNNGIEPNELITQIGIEDVNSLYYQYLVPLSSKLGREGEQYTLWVEYFDSNVLSFESLYRYIGFLPSVSLIAEVILFSEDYVKKAHHRLLKHLVQKNNIEIDIPKNQRIIFLSDFLSKDNMPSQLQIEFLKRLVTNDLDSMDRNQFYKLLTFEVENPGFFKKFNNVDALQPPRFFNLDFGSRPKARGQLIRETYKKVFGHPLNEEFQNKDGFYFAKEIAKYIIENPEKFDYIFEG